MNHAAIIDYTEQCLLLKRVIKSGPKYVMSLDLLVQKQWQM